MIFSEEYVLYSKEWRRNTMKKKLILISIFAALFITGTGLYACEMNFNLVSPEGEQKIIPGKEVWLTLGETYSLTVQFIEDHRKCVTPPEETMYILQEEKWKISKDHLPLQLIELGEWIMDSGDWWIQKIDFTPREEGTWSLEIIRDCPKGGYDEYLTFHVK